MQVHRYLQLLSKVSPLRYTAPPKTQGAPSLAGGKQAGAERVRRPLERDGGPRWGRPAQRVGIRVRGRVRAARAPSLPLSSGSPPSPSPGPCPSPGPDSPVHTPTLRAAGAPTSQKSPLCGSQRSRSPHSSPSCLAQTRQQPQPSSTRLTPAGQRGAGPGAHWHGPRQAWPAAGCGGEERGRGEVSRAADWLGPCPGRGPGPRAYRAAEGEQEREGEAGGGRGHGGRCSVGLGARLGCGGRSVGRRAGGRRRRSERAGCSRREEALRVWRRPRLL